MDRLPYWTRARRRIWQDTRASAKGRVVTLVVSIVGLALGYLYATELHQVTNWQALKIAVEAGISANILWVLGVLIVNSLRVPWLLDAESGEQIDALEQRAAAAETALDEREKVKHESKRQHDIFGFLSETGLQLLASLNRASTRSEFFSWDERFGYWVNDAQTAVRNTGFSTDAAEFLRAGTLKEPVKGVMDVRNEQETRRRELRAHQDYLADFVQRRLP